MNKKHFLITESFFKISITELQFKYFDTKI